MIPIPAIDIIEGKVVRLLHGNYSECQVYHEDPASLVKSWAEAGVRRLHLVDLAGSKDPAHRQFGVIEEMIAAAPELQVQVGGGLRSAADVHACFDAGITYAVLGSAAVNKASEVAEWINRFGPARFIIAADGRVADDLESQVRIKGWTEGTSLSVDNLISQYSDLGVKQFLVTDIGRDGAMEGPNVEWYRHLLSQYSAANLIASGGVRSLEDLRELAGVGCYAAVTGRALLEGVLPLDGLVALDRKHDQVSEGAHAG